MAERDDDETDSKTARDAAPAPATDAPTDDARAEATRAADVATAPDSAPRRFARRAGQSWVEAALGAPAAVLLALVLFGLVNYLSARHYRRFDWTRHHLFTLSPRSREIVRSLRGPTDMYILLGPREPQFSDVSELADRYAAEGRQLHVHTIDPDRQRDRFLELTRRLGLRVGRTATNDVASEAAIVLVRGDRHWEIPREALAGLGDTSAGDEGQGARTAAAQVTVERAISEAVLRVDRNEPTNVCFATGHGELPLEGGDDSMSMLVAELRHDNVAARPVDLRGTASVPTDCDALVIAGPRQSFAQNEADTVARYLRAGGNVLMLLDPMFVDRRFAPTGLEPVARLGGIELTQSVAIETDQAHLIPDALPATFTATDFGDHPITRTLRGSDARVLVTTARALRRASGAPVVPESLLRSTPGAWGETATTDAVRGGSLTRDPQDVPGPLDLAMAAQVPDVHPRRGTDEAAGRLVVIGYSHLATNEALSLGFQARFANGYLVVGSLGWLTARRELVEIPARPASAAALNISTQDIKHVRIYAMLLVPLAAALVGIAVWRARRRVDD